MRRFATLQAVLTAWLVLALSGCFLWFQPHPVATRTVSEPMIRSGPALAPIVGRISPEPATGTLRLTIHWPMGPGRDLRGYHAQLIPDSTSRIAISIQDGDTEVATASISREAGQASAGAVFKLEAAANLAVLAEAYSVVPEQLEVVQYRIQEESNPGEVLIAQGSAIVNVNKSQDTDAAIELSSLYVPAVSELSSNAARPGDLVRLSGSNLQVDWNPGGSTVIVRTVSGTASAIVSASPEAIDLTVPDGAVTGPLNVIVDGVPSPSDATLWISDDLRVNAPRAEWDTSAQDARVVLFDHVITIGATYSFRFAPQEGPSAFEEPPRPRWSARNGGTGTLSEITSDETTFVAATREGKLVAEARLGVRNTATLQLLSRAVGPFANANLNLPQTRRSGGITLGDRLYVIGDQDKRTSVFSAINPQGVLQGWVSANRDLTQARLTRPVSIGRYVYVFGGYSEDEDDILDTVERAAVDGDGEIGAFELLPIQLLWPVEGPAVFTGSYVYVLGSGEGRKGLQRALVDANGQLGAFEAVNPGLISDRYVLDPVMAGGYVYLVGGWNDSNGWFTSVDRAKVDILGGLGPFERWPGSSLNQARIGHSVVEAAGAVYVIGGSTDSGTIATVERAPVSPGGDLGPFAIVESGLKTSRHSHFTAVVGDYVYSIGGYSDSCGCNLATVERAAIPNAGEGTSQVVVR